MKTLIKSLRILLPTICSLFWLSTAQSQTYGENIFIIHDAVGKPDSTVVIYLEIVNEDNIHCIFTELPLPVGSSYVPGSAWLNPLRKKNFIVFQQNIIPGTNTLSLVFLAYTGGCINGNNGIIAGFNLNAPTETGEYLISPDSLILCSDLNENIVSGIFDGIVYITPEGSVSGDANCDGVVNVVDVIKTIQYIMGIIEKPFCFANADLNSDILVNMEDVVGTINIILDLNSGFLK